MPITPHVVVHGAEQAVAFYRDAFGAAEISRIPTPDGRLMSVQLRIGDGLMHLADEFPEMGVLAPPSIGGTASSRIRSAIAGTSISTCATCRTTRSWRRPHEPSRRRPRAEPPR